MNAKRQSSRHTFSAPDPSIEKLTSVPLIKTSLKAKSNTTLNGVESPKFRRLSS